MWYGMRLEVGASTCGSALVDEHYRWTEERRDGGGQSSSCREKV
jgi:hypothetical protein